ncbi:Hsp20/alpha crystallin family protein [Halobellus captivus]|uniref:Hsp20/alpha crystallin family protein n=1 Tax=Halobellus captivus TaxID=2592614 RepID=UPI0011A67D29|nr:Hsp20 family protein [Halobellus captivus]
MSDCGRIDPADAPHRLRELGESIAGDALERVGRGVARFQERAPLPYDLLESDGAFLAVFDAPGVRQKDVQVRFVDNEVRVRIDRFRNFHEGFEMRFPGRGLSLDGRAPLPEGVSVDPAEATATVTEAGTLQVEIPKRERDSAERDSTERGSAERETDDVEQ